MSSLFSTGRAVFEQFQSEVAENPRLLRLLWVICVLIVFYLVAYLADSISLKEQRVSQLSAELGRSASSGSVSDWEDKLIKEREAGEVLDDRCWSADDKDLASADLQTLLQSLVSRHDLVNSRLTVSSPESLGSSDSDAFLIRAQLQGRVEHDRIPILLNELENPDQYLVIRQFDLVSQSRGDTVQMMLEACFKSTTS